MRRGGHWPLTHQPRQQRCRSIQPAQEDIDRLFDHLDRMAADKRPSYGVPGKLVNLKKALLTGGTAARTHAIHFTRNDIILTDVGLGRGHRHRTTYRRGDLATVEVMKRSLANCFQRSRSRSATTPTTRRE